jgi:hypothetical protein
MSEKKFSIGTQKFKGYSSNTSVGPDYLSVDSVNMLVNEHGDVETCMGYEDTGWNLDQANKPATSFYHKTYDITFFAAGTKVLYCDHNNGNTIVDTGLTLTTGTTTRFAEYAGDLYLTNQTDGLRRIVVGRLNDAAATSGDATVTIDSDMAARLSVFSITSGNLRINGTTEAFSSLVVATGVVTLSGTLSQSYSDNTIVIVTSDISSGREKFSKLTFWKERMTGVGAVSTTNADQPNANVFFSKFTTAAVLENIINFSSGGGATVELVGKSGAVTNILPTEDYLYVFKERETYVIAVSDVDDSSGASIPNLRSPIHGCINEDCAADMGNGELSVITPEKRFIRVKIATDSGAPVIFPDESYDVGIRDDLRYMDKDQTGAFAYYYKAKRQCIHQVKIKGVWEWRIYDNNIRDWQPPRRGIFAKSLFERDGLLYATDGTDDAIYLMDSTYADNGAPIQHRAATGEFNIDDSQIQLLECKGEITPQATLNFRVSINSASLETVKPKVISGSSFSYPLGGSLGSDQMAGDMLGAGGEIEQKAEWKKVFDVFPSSGNKVRVVASSFGTANRWKWNAYTLKGTSYSNSFTPIS